LKDAVQARPHVLANPPAEAYVTKVNSDSLSVEVRAWTDQAEGWVQIRSDLAMAIYNASVQQGFTLK
jgi:small-conductance mechanosensitive channel